MVSYLTSVDPIFDTLNLVSYGRWERGLSVPSTKKMLSIVTSVDYQIEDFIKSVEFKLSKFNIKKFTDWFDFNIELGISSSILGYGSSIKDSYRMERFDSNRTIFDSLGDYLLSKIYKYELKSMGVPLDTNIDINIRHRWQSNGNLFHLLYLTNKNDLHAHMSWSLHSMNILPQFIDEYKNNQVQFILENEPNDSDLLFMYIHLAMPYDREWTNFILKEVLVFILNNPRVVKVVFNSNIKEQAFKTVDLFDGDILLTYENYNYKEPQLNRLIGIDRLDILSSHGIIDLIKSTNIIK